MRLGDLQDRFFRGGMDKADFAEAMQAIHVRLLDYADFLPRTDVARVEITEGKVLLTLRSGLRLRYQDPEDRYAVLTPLSFGNYEPLDSAQLFAYAQALFGTEPFAFLDVGANMGWYALNMALRFPACSVHAFEPVAATYRGLELNLEANGFPNVRLHPLGLSDAPGIQTIYVDPRISGRASGRNLVDDPEARPQACHFTSLDAFSREEKVAPGLIKIDVEGAERMVLEGGREILARHRPLVMCEMLRKWAAKFGYHPDAILGAMGGLGYACLHRVDGRLVELQAMTEDVASTNFFFLHRERHAALLVH
jgi:FkbM family methyltransferase